MEHTRSFAGVALDPFTKQDQAMVTRLEHRAGREPGSAEAWLAVARCHDDQGRTAQAVLANNRYFMIDPKDGRASLAASRVWKLLVPEFRNDPPATSMRFPGNSGDPWWQAELILATIRSTRHAGKLGAMSEERFFATALQGLVSFVVDLADASRMSDVWRNEIVSYFREAMVNGYLECMAYAVTRPLGRGETLRWLMAHAESATSLEAWSRGRTR
jgi:hypothetical protein